MQSRWIFAVLVLLAILPTLTFAAHNAPNTNVWDPRILGGPLTLCSGFYMGNGTTGGTPAGTYGSYSFGAIPPCQNLCDLVAQIIQVLYYFIAAGIWIFVPVLFAWGGIKMMLARGNPTKASEARKVLTGTLWGVIIMLCAWLIVSTFIHFFFSSNFIPGYLGGVGSVC